MVYVSARVNDGFLKRAAFFADLVNFDVRHRVGQGIALAYTLASRTRQMLDFETLCTFLLL